MGAIPRRFHTHCQSTLNHPTFTSTIHTRDMYALCRPCANLSHISFFSLAAIHMPLPRDSPPFPTILSHTSPKYTHTHSLSPNQTKTKIPKQHRTEKRRGGAGPGLGVSTTRITPFSTIVSRVPKPLSLSLSLFFCCLKIQQQFRVRSQN